MPPDGPSSARALGSLSGRSSHGDVTVIWEKQHIATKNRVHISQRADRVLLLSIFEQTKQRLQVRVDKFGDVPGPQPSSVPRGTPALEAAIKFMTEIAEDYVANKFPVEELTKMRDEKLVAEGIGKPGGKPRATKAAGPIKRPAVASDAIATNGTGTV